MSVEITTTEATTFVTASGTIKPEQLKVLIDAIEQTKLFELPYNSDFSKVQNFSINLQSDGSAKFNTKIKIS